MEDLKKDDQLHLEHRVNKSQLEEVHTGPRKVCGGATKICHYPSLQSLLPQKTPAILF